MSISLLLAATTLLPSPFLDNLKRERAVMESLDPMNLTWTCRVTAGLDDRGNTNTVRLGIFEACVRVYRQGDRFGIMNTVFNKA